METPLATLENGTCKAEIYEAALPGQFSVRFLSGDGTVLAEESLTGVSSYRQREQEIIQRLDEFCRGVEVKAEPLGDAGEY